jgi:hypothetical protein
LLDEEEKTAGCKTADHNLGLQLGFVITRGQRNNLEFRARNAQKGKY